MINLRSDLNKRKERIISRAFKLFIFLLVLAVPYEAGATIYEPGETLEPDCAPLSMNCGVLPVDPDDFLQVSNNFSDLLDAIASRTNLGLGTLATQNGTFSGTSSGTNTGDQTTITGNSGTATALQNARTINGISFNGTANITIADDTKVVANSSIAGATKTKITYDAKGLVLSGADATTADIAASANRNYVTDAGLIVLGNTSGTNTGDQTAATLSGTTLASNIVNSSLAGVGTISVGTWNGTTIAIANGGTNGTAAPTSGALAYGTGTAYGFTAAGSSGQVLQSAGASAPVWSTATFPATAGSDGNSLRSDGTNFVSTALIQSQATPADPSTTTSLTGVMMGLAGSITPARSGKVMIIISGDVDNNTAADGSQMQIRYGTGSAPANGAALSGTAAGGLVKMVNGNVTTAGLATGLVTLVVPTHTPFSLNAIVSGLTPSTAYWIDASLASITGGTSRIRNVSISLLEL